MTEQLPRVLQKLAYTESKPSISLSASLGDFLLAPACLIEKVTLWEGFLYFKSRIALNVDIIPVSLNSPNSF